MTFHLYIYTKMDNSLKCHLELHWFLLFFGYFLLLRRPCNQVGTTITTTFCAPVVTSDKAIDHFTVVGLVSFPLSEHEAEVDLALIQTSFLFLWKLCLKNYS